MKDEKAKNRYLNSDNAIDILERTLGYIRNCDNKASVALGAYGVILTATLSTGGFSNLLQIARAAVGQRSGLGILYLAALTASAAAIFYGISLIVKVLGVKIDVSTEEGLVDESVMFFGNICQHGYLSYRKKLASMTEEAFFDDIASQIYRNARICCEKHQNYRRGLNCSLPGMAALFIL